MPPVFNLTIAVAALSAAILSFFIVFPSTPLKGTSQSTTSSKPELDTVVNESFSKLELTASSARPLFSPSRRPFVARTIEPEMSDKIETPPEHIEEKLPRDLQLLGVNSDGQDLTVLVKKKNSDDIRWLRKGDNFGGWTLSYADKDSARFSCEARSSEDCFYNVELYSAEDIPKIED